MAFGGTHRDKPSRKKPDKEKQDIDKIYRDNYTYIKYKEFGGRMHKYFKCNKCGEFVEEFCLYSHLEDHKNPEAKFGVEMLEELAKMGEEALKVMENRLTEEEVREVSRMIEEGLDEQEDKKSKKKDGREYDFYK